MSGRGRSARRAPRAPRGLLAGGLALAVLAAPLAGCLTDLSPICDRSIEANPPVRYTEGTTEAGLYATSALDGELLWFPGGMHYELVHGLAAPPKAFHVYLSFDRYGTRKGDTLAEATGNQAELVRADAETLVLKNGSCVDYWMLATAEAD